MMVTDLEQRLRAAGEHIDRQVEQRSRARVDDQRFAEQRRPWWSLVMAASAGALVVLALVWVADRNHSTTPTAPPSADTALAPNDAATTALGPATTAVATTTPSTVAATATEPPLPPPPVAIGESVMLGAQPQLEAGGFEVIAMKASQGDDVAATVRELRAAGRIGDTVVIQTGTNGQVLTDTFDEMMSYLPADEVRTVVFLTVRAPGKGWIDGNNERIWALPGRYPNVTVLDWRRLVDSGQIAGVAGDGIHLGTNAAKQTYANFIFDVIGRVDLVRQVATG